MIDLHTHILPFVDDGARTTEETVALLLREVENGVKTIFATPHYRVHGSYEKDRMVYEKHLQWINSYIQEKKLDLTTVLGSEILYDKKVYSLLDEGKIPTLGKSRYILLEFEKTPPKEDINEILYNFRLSNYQVIIAHPERYPYLNKIDDFESLREEGALFQVNAGSLTGKEGPRESKMAWLLMSQGWVDFVASDCHYHRLNEMKKSAEMVLAKYGENVQRSIFIHNPQKVLRAARGIQE